MDHLLIQVLERMPDVSIKNYPSINETLEELQAKYPRLNWNVREPEWRRQEEYRMELVRRMYKGETGVDMLVKPLVPNHPVMYMGEQVMVVKDLFKAIPGGKEVDACKFDSSTHKWELMPSLVANEQLADYVADTIIASLPPHWKGEVPSWCRHGPGMRSAAAGVIRSQLYDRAFFQNIDSEATRQFVMFKNGILFDRDTYRVRPACANDLISNSLGIDYPGKQLEKIATEDVGRLEVTLRKVKILEATQGDEYKHLKIFADNLLKELEVNLGQFTVGQFLWACQEDWSMVIYILKHAARAFFALKLTLGVLDELERPRDRGDAAFQTAVHAGESHVHIRGDLQGEEW